MTDLNNQKPAAPPQSSPQRPARCFFAPILLVPVFCSLFAALAVLALPAAARADEFSVCVICNDPGKVYQCSLSYQPPEGSISGPNQRGLQFACIQEVARYGNHGQCAANRKTALECGGEPYRLRNQSVLYQPNPVEAIEEPDTSSEQPDQPIVTKQDPQDPADVEAPVKVKKKDQQPSLVDTTEQTYEATKDTVKKGYEKTSDSVKTGYDKTSDTVKKTVKSVGDGIGSAAKTTYNCLTSFFQKCSN